ncbi:MAG: carboxypeptidase regulatory-like domain-containing protein [Methanomassiliicoccales archaeon]|nr:carboxypeptidase regulatory-like domain-containing protein [Methanomassiliicoccales archaeon]
MASIEGGSGGPTKRSRLNFLSGLGKGSSTWLRQNWRTAAILVFIVLLAFFVRSYFVLGPSIDNGYLVSGGSDSYYHERVIDYVTQTGHHLYTDTLLNYPWDLRNPRPPLFDWSVAVTGMVMSSVTGSPVSDSTGFTLVSATAFWGALTCIPVYMIGRQAFGRKVGLAAAFLFAMMPAHIERSVASEADHDAMVLFLVVFCFYFLLMSLKSIVGDKWVSNWRGRKAITSGLGQYFKANQVSVIYAALAGVCVAAVAFIWTGYMYILIIVLVYFLVQLMINLFKKTDSMGVWINVSIMLGLAFLLIFPLYWVMDYWYTWFVVPLILFLAMMVVGAMFTLTRDLPWVLILPIFIIIAVVGLTVISFVSPNLFDAIITGQGYLVKSKLYSTISEAQAPNFSTLAMSFGIVTFWLALAGIGYALIKIPKNLAAYFVFLVVWTATAIFMAASAGRFLFNAAPAFAVMGAWVLVLIIDAVRFQDYPKGVSSASMTKNPFTWLRKVFNVKYVLAVFFVLMLVLVPNVWGAVDAGIPSEYKETYDNQIYDAMPQVLRPTDYKAPWYLGAFGYSLPLPSQYFPAAWDWYSDQDVDLAVTERPAFLSWWDYGFEAVQAGDHPTVADNFQNGYQFAGNYITCTDENQAIAMLITRCIEYGDISEGSAISDAMVSHGVDMVELRSILENPSPYISVVLANPDVYGNFTQDLSALNAKYVASRVEIAKIGEEQCASLYHDIREITGSDIGYFAIDSRLFPFSATGYNIFYAPCKLSDHEISEVSNSPVDFYQIYATVITASNVEETIPLDEVTSDMTITDYSIVYTDLFYQTMLYRAFMGYGPYDIGYSEQGIPGFSGSLASLPPMQAWNQTHFRMVYKTAYYNPYPEEEVANHTDAWKAISYDEALELQKQIAAGEAMGVVDVSAYDLAQGIVFVQYYDGAIIEGQVTTDSGLPYPGLWVTVLDEYGIPHDYVQTDSEGRYSLIAPFGEVKIVYSYGELDKRTLMGTELTRTKTTVSYSQAMRQTEYHINGDMSIASTNLNGNVYWDVDGDGAYTSGTDTIISGATVVAENQDLGFKAQTTSTDSGYLISYVPAVDAQVYAIVDGHPTTPKSVQLMPLADTTVDIAIKPATIKGTISYTDGTKAAGFEVELVDYTNGTTTTATTDSSGKFAFNDLVYGTYELLSGVSGTTLGQLKYNLTNGETVSESLTVKDVMTINGQAWLSTGIVASNATISIYNEESTYVVQADSAGRYSASIPAGQYDMHIMASLNGIDFAYLNQLAKSSGTLSLNPLLVPAYYVQGNVQGTSVLSGLTIRFESRSNGAVISAITNSTGQFRLLIPNDVYFVYNGESGGAYWGDVTVTSSGPLTLSLSSSARISGTVWYDADGDSVMDSAEAMSGVPVQVMDVDGRVIVKETDSSGKYEFQLAPGKNYDLAVDLDGYFPHTKSFSQLSGSKTENVQMVAVNRTVTAVVTFEGATMPGVNITFDATSGSAQSLTATSSAGGLIGIQLKPGVYQVLADQDVVAGNNVSKYQYGASLTVSVGSDPSLLNIELVKRYLVTGAITPDRSAQAKITISGPDSKELRATGTFSTYLQPGNYSFYVLIEKLGSRYATLVNETIVNGANSIELVNQVAYFIQGTVKADGKTITAIAPVVISNVLGGDLTLTTSVAGSFTTYLPAGSYVATVDYRTQEVLETKDRYVRYQGSLSFVVNSTKSLTVPVQKQLDNSTISGTVRVSGQNVAATLEFVPSSSTAIWTNATGTASGYTTELAPGNYSIYIKEISGPAVFMGTIDIAPYTSTNLNFDLVPGVRYFGVTQLGGIAGPAVLEFSSENYKTLTSAADGSFEVYLPPDVYQVRATGSGVEQGASAEYSSEFTLNLQDSQSSIINLVKVADYGVDLQWDTTERRTVEAGESVSYNLRVINTGNSADSYTLSVQTAASGWTVAFSQNPVSVGFGTSNSQLVTVTITTPANAKVSHQSVTIRALSSHSTKSDTVNMDVGIVPSYSVSMSYVSAQATTGEDYEYKMSLTNTGNVDDTYVITVTNSEELATWGWEAQVRLSGGTWSNNLTALLSSGSKSNFELRLTPIRENPDGQVTVVLNAASKGSSGTYTVLEFEPSLPAFNIPGGLSVTGNGVSTQAPEIPLFTLALLGLLFAVSTILILVIIQKGVLKRKKR